MQAFSVQKNKCLAPALTVIGTYSGTLTYGQSGSNYTNITTDIANTEDLTKYYCLVRSNGYVNVYANVINTGGSVVVQARTDYRENTTLNTVDVNVVVVKVGQ